MLKVIYTWGKLAKSLFHSFLNTHNEKPTALMGRSIEPSAESFFVPGWALYPNVDRSGTSKAIQEAITLGPNNPKYRQIHEHLKSTT